LTREPVPAQAIPTVRLIITVPDSAPRRELDDDRTSVVLEGPGPRPAITLTIYHPRILPMSLIEWSSVVTRVDVPVEMKAKDETVPPDKCRVGWEMRVLKTSLFRPKEKQPFELRLTAFYLITPFQPYAAAAVARFLDPARFEAAKPWIIDLFEGGRPDFGGQIVSLSQLYE
jgi:hypothetical protein